MVSPAPESVIYIKKNVGTILWNEIYDMKNLFAGIKKKCWLNCKEYSSSSFNKHTNTDTRNRAREMVVAATTITQRY